MILVTGATGLVGSHLLAQLLPKEEELRATYRSKSRKEETENFLNGLLKGHAHKLLSKIEWVQADITDIPALSTAFEGVTQVYHCAGMISYAVGDEQKLRKINIEGTANVVNIALANGVKKMCHVSSVAALGSEIRQKPITESSQRNNEAEHSNYSISKFGAEMEVWRASQEGLPVVLVNPGIIIGPGNWKTGSGQLFSRVDRGLRYYPRMQTGFVAVEDVVKAMIQLMKSPIKNEGYILVAENLSFKYVLDHIAEILKKPAPQKPLQQWMIALGWVFQSVGHGLFGTKKEITREAITGVFKQTTYNHKKLESALDFEFMPIDEAIRKTGKKYLSR